MKKKLYHGSSKVIEKPVYGYGKTYNDYGLGFYCTDSLEMAQAEYLMALSRVLCCEMEDLIEKIE